MKPKISVLMPVYNGEKYLDEAINSILNQTFYDFEFLIIDDASTDKSKEIISKYSENDKRVNAVFHKINKGLIFSLNHGLKLAKGKFIARMDQDDISCPERLAKQYNYLVKHKSIAVIGCWVKTIDIKGNLIGVRKHEKDPLILKWNCLFGTPIDHPTAFIDSNTFRKIGFYNPKAINYEDYDLWSRICLTGFKMSNLPEFLLKYRIHPESITGKFHSKQQVGKLKLIYSNISIYTDITKEEIRFLKEKTILSWNFIQELKRKKKIYTLILDSFIKIEKPNNVQIIKLQRRLRQFNPIIFILEKIIFKLI